MENYLYTQNREFSWLRFNQRVLEEAADPTLPPLERLKFVSIFSSNLDEFFMVRAGSLFDIAAMEPNQVDNKSGLTPQQQLVGIYQMTAALVGQKEQVYGEVCRSLEVQASPMCPSPPSPSRRLTTPGEYSGIRFSRCSPPRLWTAATPPPISATSSCISPPW